MNPNFFFYHTSCLNQQPIFVGHSIAVVQGTPRERDGTWVKEIELTRSSPGGRSSELKVGLFTVLRLS